jgi:hypothetical protein
MDADDISLRSRFEKQVVYLENHADVAVLGGAAEIFDENGRVRHHHCANDPGQMKIDMLFACGIAHPSVMMRRSVICQLGGYDPAFNGLEDYELWCRVLEKHEITALADVLLRYRIHSSQVTKNPSPQHLEKMRALKLRQVERLGIGAEEATPFFRLNEEGRPRTVEHIRELDQFFALVDKSNQKLGIYDGKKLQETFCSVILAAANALPRSSRMELAEKCAFLRKKDLLWQNVKQKAKKFLGRG